jgi:hypothetical protein
MKATIFSIFLVSSVFCFSQDNYLQINTYFGLQPNNNEIQYVSYNHKIILSDCEIFSQCPNKTPEELMQSLLSAKSYEWDKKNYDYQITNDKEYNKKTNTDFFRLTNKLSFSLGEENYCLIKYLIISENKELPMASLMKMSNGIWRLISPQENMTTLMLMFEYLSCSALDGIFLQKTIGVPTFDNMVKSVYFNQTLLLSKALKMRPSKSYTENEGKIIFGLNSNALVNSRNVKTDIIFLLSKQSLFKYVDNSYYNSKKDTLLNILISKLNFSNEVKIIPVFRFNFNYDSQNFIILKINKMINNIEKKEELFTFIEKNNKWILQKNLTSDVLKKINYVMTKSNISLLESLNIISPKENLIIVNKVRNLDNYIDIEKLSIL